MTFITYKRRLKNVIKKGSFLLGIIVSANEKKKINIFVFKISKLLIPPYMNMCLWESALLCCDK